MKKIIIILLISTMNIYSTPNPLKLHNVVIYKTTQIVTTEMISPYCETRETNIYKFIRYDQSAYTDNDRYYTGYFIGNNVSYMYLCIDRQGQGVLLTWSTDNVFLFNESIMIDIEETQLYYICSFEENNIKVKIKISKKINI